MSKLLNLPFSFKPDPPGARLHQKKAGLSLLFLRSNAAQSAPAQAGKFLLVDNVGAFRRRKIECRSRNRRIHFHIAEAHIGGLSQRILQDHQGRRFIGAKTDGQALKCAIALFRIKRVIGFGLIRLGYPVRMHDLAGIA